MACNLASSLTRFSCIKYRYFSYGLRLRLYRPSTYFSSLLSYAHISTIGHPRPDSVCRFRLQTGGGVYRSAHDSYDEADALRTADPDVHHRAVHVKAVHKPVHVKPVHKTVFVPPYPPVSGVNFEVGNGLVSGRESLITFSSIFVEI